MRRLPLFFACALAVTLLVDGRVAAAGRVDHEAWAETSPIATFVPQSGHLYVAATAGNEEARTFIHLDVTGLGSSEIAASKLVVREASDSMLATDAKVIVCALAGVLASDGQLTSPPPAVNCEIRTNASRAPDGAWTIDLGVFAETWSAGADSGLALLPDTSALGTTFRVALDSSQTAVMVPTPAAVATAPTTEQPVPPAELAAPFITSEPPLSATPEAPSTPSATGPSSAGILTTPPSQRGRPPRAATALTNPEAHWVNSPPVAPFLAVALGLTLVGLLRVPRRRRLVLPARLAAPKGSGLAVAAIATAVLLLPMAAREAFAYKAGLVLIFFVAALGLHVIVNWAGDLSLAHAELVGLPAFVVLAVSNVAHVSPIYLLPLGMVVGAASGALVGLPTLRAKGLQVALVTLAAGIAIDRFFFTRTWLVGSGAGRAAAIPRLGPLSFETSRSLYPVLVVVVVVVVVAIWALLHSRVGRAWFWVRSDPAAAAVFGIPVVTYRLAAYAVGGCLAGLAGGLTVMWVQRLTPAAFPTTLSFTYVIVAVLSGPGFVGGLAAAAVGLEGIGVFFSGFGPVLTYLGAIGLVINITRYPEGLNGLGRSIMNRIRARLARNRPPGEPRELERISLAFVGGCLAVVAGFVAIGIAWYHAGNTNQTWIQNQLLISGGLGGLALVLFGTGLLIRDRLGAGQAALLRELLPQPPRSVDASKNAAATDTEPIAARTNRGARGRARMRGPLERTTADD